MKKITMFLLMMSISNLYAQNQMQIVNLSMVDAYSQIPLDQVLPFTIEAKFLNNGTLMQNNVKLYVKELTTQTVYVSDSLSSFYPGNYDSLRIDSIILPNSIGTYYITAWISSNTINQLIYSDTFKISINNNNILSRDNSNYTGFRWAGTTAPYADPYTATNIYKVKKKANANSVIFVVDSATKPGSKVKAVLYKFSENMPYRIQVAQSSNYYINSYDIPTTHGQNPHLITLAFTSPYLLLPDTIYYAGIQVFGGTDTVKIATDNTATPQDPQNSPYFDPVMNSWFIWVDGPAPAMMIRLNAVIVINPLVSDLNVSSLTLFPNPVKSILNMDIGGWKANETSVTVFSITGIEVLKSEITLSEMEKVLQLDVSQLSKGMYFIQIKNAKQSIIKKFIKE
jgi:hypothetical protein